MGYNNLSDYTKLALSYLPVAYWDITQSSYTVDKTVRVATTSDLGGTYANGTSGVGATLTITSTSTIDGVTLANNDRILVKNQVTAAQNGIYVRTSATVLTRATDFDQSAEVSAGARTYVSEGSVNGNNLFFVSFVSTTIVMGTDSIAANPWGDELSLTPEASSIQIMKKNITTSNRSLVYGIKDKSCMLLGPTSAASTISIPMTSLNFAKTGSEKNPFTISFWYQHLSTTFSSTTPIMAIGSDIKLFFSGEKFYMTFRGKTLYASVSDWRELFFISIIFDGTIPYLHINGYQGNSFGTDSKTFISNTSIVFSSDDNAKFQISGLAIYNYDLDLSQIEYLNQSNTFIDRYALFNANNMSKVVGSYFFDSNLIFSYSPDKMSSVFRNSIYSNGEITLPSKAMASVQGSPTFSSSGATFIASSGIKIPADDLDVMDSTLTFTTSGLGTGSSGTLFYIESGTPISAKIVGLTIDIYAGTTKLNASTISITANSTIKFIFNSKNVYISIDNSTPTLVYTVVNSAFDYIMIGNNSALSSFLSTGKIRTVAINYYNNPLSQGKYILDLNNAYVNGTTKIKPKQDGVATWSVALPEVFETTELIYNSSSTSSIKTFLSTDSVTTANWLSGAYGYLVDSGTSVKSLDGTPVVKTSGTRKIINFTAYLNDTEVTTNSYIQSLPKISSILLKVFSSGNIYSGNSNIIMSSTDQDAFIISDSEASNSKKMIEGFKVYTNSSISFSNLNYPNSTSPLTASIRLRMDDFIKNYDISSKVATTAALGNIGNLAGGTITTTYNNGTAGVGATLTIATSSAWTSITIDGQTLAVADRVIIKNQANALQNGVYTVTTLGGLGNTTSFVFTRATDFDTSAEIAASYRVLVTAGTANANKVFSTSFLATNTIGTTAMTWAEYDTDILTLTGPASTTKISMIKSGSTYNLYFTNISTRYLDGATYASETLNQYNDYILTFIMPSGVTAMAIKNLKGFAIGSIDFFNSTLTSTNALNQFQYTLGTDSLRITETTTSADIFGIDSAPIVSIIDGYSIISS